MGKQVRMFRPRTTRNEHRSLDPLNPRDSYRKWRCPDCGTSGTLKQVTRAPCVRRGERKAFAVSEHFEDLPDAS